MGARIVFIGDDFTGASDSLAAYARRGLRARLVTGDSAPRTDLDVLGIATDLRSLPPAQALKTLHRLWPMVEAEGPEILHLKVCSTFDSAPGVGSIGAVASELRRLYQPDILAVIGGQPSLGRHCVFGTLFARGPDGEVHRIDRHPVMARHPVTPMTEADLTRHLAAQGLDLPLRIAAPDLADPARTAAQLAEGAALVDVMSPQDQALIRAALDLLPGRKLLIGASSVAEVLGGDLGEAPAQQTTPAPQQARRDGGVLVFAGSRSSVTAAQVEAAGAFHRVPLTPALLSQSGSAGRLAADLPLGQDILMHLIPEADYRRDPASLADVCASFVQEVMTTYPTRALGLAGGDTSSRIVAQLGFEALDFDRDFGQGACVCRGLHVDQRLDALPILLKGGQMGAPSLFRDFAEAY